MSKVKDVLIVLAIVALVVVISNRKVLADELQLTSVCTEVYAHGGHYHHINKTDMQFEKRIAVVNAANRHLRLEISELRGYLRSFGPPVHKRPVRREFL